MFKPLELFIGLRYTRAKRRNRFISFISFSSMFGIALGVMAMIVVLSVMNGFAKEVRERMLDMISHLTVTNIGGQLEAWEEVVTLTEKHPDVLAAAPYIQQQGMLIYHGMVNGSVIRGIEPTMETKVSKVAARMKTGKLVDLKPGKFGIVLGHALALKLGVVPGDKVTLVTPSANVSPAGIAPRLKRFTVVGEFEVGHQIYDANMALVHINDAARLFRMQDRVTGVRTRLDDLFKAPKVRMELQSSELAGFWVRDWSSYNANWFRAVKQEKILIFILMSLIMAVAAFNIVSTMVMMVGDKQSDIAILRTLGASPSSIMMIFITQGTIIGTVGILLGAVSGVSLALNLEVVVPWVERLLGFHFIDPTIYYISELPSDLHWDDVWLICIVAFTMSLVSTLYPAWRASRTHPADALRYE